MTCMQRSAIRKPGLRFRFGRRNRRKGLIGTILENADRRRDALYRFGPDRHKPVVALIERSGNVARNHARDMVRLCRTGR